MDFGRIFNIQYQLNFQCGPSLPVPKLKSHLEETRLGIQIAKTLCSWTEYCFKYESRTRWNRGEREREMTWVATRHVRERKKMCRREEEAKISLGSFTRHKEEGLTSTHWLTQLSASSCHWILRLEQFQNRSKLREREMWTHTKREGSKEEEELRSRRCSVSSVCAKIRGFKLERKE